MSVYVMGVDPGFSGAIAFYDASKKLLASVHDMPLLPREKVRGGGNAIDLYALAVIVELYAKDTILAVIEEVGARPKEGVSSVFKFGYGAGAVAGITAGALIPMRLVPPQTWKGLLALTADKKLSNVKASSLFPEHKDKFSRVKDNGRSEAALLAYFGVRFIPLLKNRKGA